MQCLLPLADAAVDKMCIWLSNKWQWSANEKIEFYLYQTRLVPSSSTQKVTMHGYCTLKIRICDGLMVTRGIYPYLAYSLEYTQTHRISVHPADAVREHMSEAKVPTLRFVRILVICRSLLSILRAMKPRLGEPHNLLLLVIKEAAINMYLAYITKTRWRLTTALYHLQRIPALIHYTLDTIFV